MNWEVYLIVSAIQHWLTSNITFFEGIRYDRRINPSDSF